MNPFHKALLLSLLTPGLGYIQTGYRKAFFKTMLVFFSVFSLSIVLRGITNFVGIVSIIISLTLIYLVALTHSTLLAKRTNVYITISIWRKLFFSLGFLFVMGATFANRHFTMGVDIMHMAVPAMQPTLLPGERFIVNPWSYSHRAPKRGDVVAHTFVKQSGVFINRIIAVGGDVITIQKGQVLVNGQPLVEPYILPANAISPASRIMKAIRIPKGHYFVMGDNRDASLGDSRFSGPIALPQIVGQLTDILTSSYSGRIGTRIQ